MSVGRMYLMIGIAKPWGAAITLQLTFSATTLQVCKRLLINMGNDGFTMFHETTDVNECDFDLDNCHTHAMCTNLDVGFNCTCISGYGGNGSYCESQWFSLFSILLLLLCNGRY